MLLGFVLWQTKEDVGTPEDKADLICFINGKSTRARTGLVVHMTAPTIHSTWHGHVTLEIVNLGPLNIVLEENDHFLPWNAERLIRDTTVRAALSAAEATSEPIDTK